MQNVNKQLGNGSIILVINKVQAYSTYFDPC